METYFLYLVANKQFKAVVNILDSNEDAKEYIKEFCSRTNQEPLDYEIIMIQKTYFRKY